jgi:hypothetical protein
MQEGAYFAERPEMICRETDKGQKHVEVERLILLSRHVPFDCQIL